MTEWNRAKNMPDFLQLLERRAGDDVIIRYLSEGIVCQMTGREFYDYARRCAAVVRRSGLAGKHVGLMGANRWQWLAFLCGIFYAGGVAVLMSPELNPEEIRSRAEQTDLTAIICDEELMSNVRSTDVAAVSMDRIPAFSGNMPVDSQSNPDDLACILFTSGTTSRCRAVMFTHRALLAGFCHNVIGIPFRSMLVVLPLHHVAGFASALNTWYLGRTVCLGEQVKHLYRYLEKMKPDYVLTVPAILQVILKKLKNAGPNGCELGWDLHLLGCGGAKFPPDVVQKLNSHNIRILQSYGATEAGGIGLDWEMTPDNCDTIGKTCPEMQVRIRDGELYLRCASMMIGYYKDPEQTGKALIDGWYATGDLCEMDEDGYLYLRGRKNNLIILSNGENVSPEEIEEALLRQGLLGEILVGLENGLITAWVYPERGGSPGAVETRIQQYNETVPRYKQIQNLVILEEPLEKTHNGKTKRINKREGSL